MTLEQKTQKGKKTELQILVGQNVKKYREKKNLSQIQLSELSNIPQENISKLENGKLNITLNVISKLIVPLDIEVYKLFK